MQQVDELKTATRGDGPGENGSESSKVSFQPEQQAKVQQLIDEAYRKAYSKANKLGASSEEVDSLRTEVERLRQEKKAAHVLRAVARHNVVDAEEVAELLKGRIRMDDSGGVSIVGETGSALINSTGVPMSVEEYVAHWLSERPHHLRASTSAGAGSQSLRFGSGRSRHDLSDPTAWRSMPREDLDGILKEGINIHGSAGQVYRFRDVRNPFVEAKKRKFQKSGPVMDGAGS